MNLILCYTPLQVLIAEKIIELYPNEKFYGVMLCSVKNPKFDYYATRLAQKCHQFYSLVQKTDRIGLFKQIIALKLKFSRKRFDKVFLASINDIQIQFILSSICFEQLYTFDDGTANIVPSSVYYQPEINTLIRQGINLLLGNKFSITQIKALSQSHYTIYPNYPNIINNTQSIKLGNDMVEKIEESSIVNLLLGQPIYAENEKNIALTKQVIEQFKIDYYLPHPREQYQLENVSYIKTPLIFEDYISQTSENKKYRIYTYFSSGVLNVISNPNLEIYAIQIDVDKPEYIECYDLFAKLGIKVIDIRAN